MTGSNVTMGINWVSSIQQKRVADPLIPFGEHLECVLTKPASLESGLVGRVTEDLMFHGKVVIPAGTKVMGKPRLGAHPDRIYGDEEWTLIFPGEEQPKIKVKAATCAYKPTPDRKSFDPYVHRSPGIIGQRIALASDEDLKHVAQAAAQAAMEAARSSRTTFTRGGAVLSETSQNVAMAAANAALQQSISRSIDPTPRPLFMVIVPTGTQFSLQFLPP